MTTLVPNTQASGVEAYEDMFKEITKKLYGEEASQSLHTPMAHAALDVERSFTNLVSRAAFPNFTAHFFAAQSFVFRSQIFGICTVNRSECGAAD